MLFIYLATFGLGAFLTLKLWACFCQEELDFAAYDDAMELQRAADRSVSEATGMTKTAAESAGEEPENVATADESAGVAAG